MGVRRVIPALVPRDRDDGQVIAAVDAEVARIEEEVVGVAFAHDLEACVGGHPRDGNHRFIDDAADLPAVGQALSFAQVDPDGWHDLIPFRTRGSENSEGMRQPTVAFRIVAVDT